MCETETREDGGETDGGMEQGGEEEDGGKRDGGEKREGEQEPLPLPQHPAYQPTVPFCLFSLQFLF